MPGSLPPQRDDLKTSERHLIRASAADVFLQTRMLLEDRLSVLHADAVAPWRSIANILALNAALIRRNHELEADIAVQRDEAVGPAALRPVTNPSAAPSAYKTNLRLVPDQRLAAPAGADAATAASGILGRTPRQTQVLNLVLSGQPSKSIAADLNISQRTVKNHRTAIMQRTGASSLPALARIAVGEASAANCPLRHIAQALP